MRHTRARRMAVLTFTAVIAAGSIAACGSSSSSSSSSTAAGAAGAAGGSATAAAGPGTGANRAKLVACLKQHGVTLPSRPPGGGQGPGAGGGSGTTPGSGSGTGRGRPPGGGTKFRTAFQACGAAGGFRRRGGTLQRASITKFVTCVRQHGYNLPKPNFSGKGSIFPPKIQRDPKFKSASRACQSQLAPAPGAPAGAGAPPASGA